MKHLELFTEWISSSTFDDYKMEYKSKDKIYYGVHTIQVSKDGKSTDVKCKFDTGARSSSIDFKVATRLGLSNKVIEECKRLGRIKISKTISKKEQKRLEKKYSKELSSKFPEIKYVKMSKSASGFSIRAYISVGIHYHGNNVSTEVNLRDRTGLSCEMLLGLKDML